MIGDWLSSDRPPLQSGLYLLLFHSWLPHVSVIYQGLSTWAQALIVVPLLVLTGNLRRLQQAAILFALAPSPLVLLSGLFVWPKLFTATFCAIFRIGLFGPGSIARPARWSMAGLAAALAMLSHGGALFALVGSTAAFLLLKRGQALPVLVRTGALAVAAYLLWVAYQRLIDPPGDRLLKRHFAGHAPLTKDSLGPRSACGLYRSRPRAMARRAHLQSEQPDARQLHLFGRRSGIVMESQPGCDHRHRREQLFLRRLFDVVRITAVVAALRCLRVRQTPRSEPGAASLRHGARSRAVAPVLDPGDIRAWVDLDSSGRLLRLPDDHVVAHAGSVLSAGAIYRRVAQRRGCCSCLRLRQPLCCRDLRDSCLRHADIGGQVARRLHSSFSGSTTEENQWC